MEKQFGGYFLPATMHVDPFILERQPTEKRTPLIPNPLLQGPPVPARTVEQLFEPVADWDGARGLNDDVLGGGDR